MFTTHRRFLAAGAAVVLTGVSFAAASANRAADVPAPASSAAKATVTVGAESVLTSARPGRSHTNVDVAWNGQMYLVVWEEVPSGTGYSQIYASRVTAGGRVLDPGGLKLSTSEQNHGVPTVAASPHEFLVAWEEQPEGTYFDLASALVSPGGVVTRAGGLSWTDNDQLAPDITWTGDLFFAAWEDMPEGGDMDIFASRVLRNGITMDGCAHWCLNVNALGLPVREQPDIQQRAPALANVNGEAFVAWQDDDAATPADIWMNVMAMNGEPYFEGGLPVVIAGGTQTAPAVAANASQVLLAWTDARAGSTTDLYLRTFDFANNYYYYEPPPAGPGRVLSTAPADQSEPSLSAFDTGFLAAWTDERSGNSDIVASRIGPKGAVLDANGVVIAGGPRTQHGGVVAGGGNAHLVVYERDAVAAPYGGRDRVFFRMVG